MSCKLWTKDLLNEIHARHKMIVLDSISLSENGNYLWESIETILFDSLGTTSDQTNFGRPYIRSEAVVTRVRQYLIGLYDDVRVGNENLCQCPSPAAFATRKILYGVTDSLRKDVMNKLINPWQQRIRRDYVRASC